nr:hypothetical protein [uncultured Flavobacterium sp.]
MFASRKEANDFEANLNAVFIEQNDYLKTEKLSQWYQLTKQRVSLFKDIFLNPVFWFLWISSFLVFKFLPFENHKEIVSNLDVLPIALPIISFVFFGIYYFVSKNKVTSTFGAFFTLSFISMFYLYFGIHWVRKFSELPSLILLSGFTSTSFMFYYLPVYYKIKNDKKFQTLFQ